MADVQLHIANLRPQLIVNPQKPIELRFLAYRDSSTAALDAAAAVAADLAAHEADSNAHGKWQYVHLQPTPANGATITHNLGRLVSNVFVEDTGGNDWAATIQNIDNNTTYIYIGQTMAFTAILT